MEEILIKICDYNHNYRGCGSISDSLLLVDVLVGATYLAYGAVCIFLLCARRNLKLESSTGMLSLMLSSCLFKIAQLSVISHSFATSIILHYLFIVTHLLVVALNIITPKTLSKVAKVDKTIVPARQQVTQSPVIYAIFGSMALVSLSNMITLFLFAFDSWSVSRYVIYHTLQFIVTPVYLLGFLAPMLAYVGFHQNRNGIKALASHIPINSVSSGDDAATPKPELLNALKELYAVNLHGFIGFFVAPIALVIEVVGIYLPLNEVLAAKISSEIISMSVNILIISFLKGEIKVKRHEGTSETREPERTPSLPTVKLKSGLVKTQASGE